MFNILNKNNEKPTGQKTWNEKFHFKDQEWKKNYIYPFNIIKNPAMQRFQRSINHNILVTNHHLVQMKLTNDSYSYYCHSQDETISHLFWTCDRIQLFLNELLQWLRKDNIQCEITEECFIVGLYRKNVIPKPLNIILLYAKYCVYRTRCNQHTLFFDIRKNYYYYIRHLRKLLFQIINSQIFAKTGTHMTPYQVI